MDDYQHTLMQLEELRHAAKVKKLNEDLLDHLQNTLIWLVQYSHRNNIPLPNVEQLHDAVKRANASMDEISRLTRRSPTKANTHEKHPDSKQNLIVVLFKRRGVQGRVFKNGWPFCGRNGRCGRKRQSMIITALQRQQTLER